MTNNTYGVDVKLYERGYWSRPFTYLSKDIYKKGDVVLVPVQDFMAVGKVVRCADVDFFQLKEGIVYKNVIMKVELPNEAAS